ncbi:unnamed protein product [Brachionus calyciflorus]|uniref:MPP5 n=1 Tax=Brachionus calyciflorus TaxID=104777 RepID=A0A813VR37_9BILA|nr:unnamed protein product [Brachionus calyciflorus]
MVMQTESKGIMSTLIPKLGKKHVTSSPHTKRQAPPPPPTVHELSINVDKIDQHSSLFSTSSTCSNDKKLFTSSSTSSSKNKSVSVSSPSSTGSSESAIFSSSSSSPKTRKFFNNFDSNVTDYFEEILIDESCDHREMPIDCPENFIPEFKTKPCFPPPPSQPQQLVQNKLLTFFNQSYSSMQFIDEESKSKLNITETKEIPFQEPVIDSKPNLGKILFEKQKMGLVNNGFEQDEFDLKPIEREQDEKLVDLIVQDDSDKRIDLNQIHSHMDLIKNQIQTFNYDEVKNLNEIEMDLLIKSYDKDVNGLNELTTTTQFKNTLSLYNKFISVCSKYDFKPVTVDATHLVKDVMKLIENYNKLDLNCEYTELSRLLNNLKSLIKTHDECGVNYEDLNLKQQNQNKSLAFKLKKLEDEKIDLPKETEVIDDDEDETLISDEGKFLLKKAEHYNVDNLKLVNIEKTEAPLGATIRNKDGNIIISRIVIGGAAHESGLLHEDDEILEINNLPVRGKTISDICELLSNLTGIVSFLIIPNMSYEPVDMDSQIRPIKIQDKTIHIRALFNYNPQEDLYLPCKELGLQFTKGDILHVISEDDSQWWQAYKEDGLTQSSSSSLAGLIPSQQFQEKRNEKLQSMIGDSFMDRKKRGFCYRRNLKNSRRKFLGPIDEVLTYEEVVLYKPVQKRPIILIGPHSIGRHELRKKLMQTYPSMFEVAVPHTTRSQRKDEINGKDYHFIPKHIFEVDIKQGRFIEHGEFEKNLYGTSHESIKKVIQNEKICVLNLYPQALKALRSSDLIPYIIYIGPPNLNKLKELKTSMGESFKECDLLDVIDKGREMEELYGHYFDKTIRNFDMQSTFDELYETICKVHNEHTWIPVSWLNNNK